MQKNNEQYKYDQRKESVKMIESILLKNDVEKTPYIKTLVDEISGCIMMDQFDKFSTNVSEFLENIAMNTKPSMTAVERYNTIKGLFENLHMMYADLERPEMNTMDSVNELFSDGEAAIEQQIYLEDRLECFEHATNFLRKGYYIITGTANTGKSSFMQSVVLSAIMGGKNEKARAVYYTLDDTKNEILCRIMSAISYKMHLNSITKEKPEGGVPAIPTYCIDSYNYTPESNGFISLAVLKDMIKRKVLEVVDRRQVPTAIDLEQDIKKRITEHPKTIVCIDGAYKIEIPKTFGEDAHTKRANFLQNLAIDYDCPLLTVHDLKKGIDSTNVIDEDLKGSNAYGYNAKFIMSLYCAEMGEKSDTLEAKIVKNKLRDTKGYTDLKSSKAFGYVEGSYEQNGVELWRSFSNVAKTFEKNGRDGFRGV